VRSVHRQFVLPIALHKAIGSPGFTSWSRTSSTVSACCGSSAHRLRSSPNGARPSHRSDGVHGQPSGARALAAAGHQVRALVRGRRAVTRPPRRGIELAIGDSARPACARRAVAGVEVVYNIAAIYRQAGVPADTYRAVNATAVGELVAQSARAGVRRVVHCSTVGVHGDIEHPPAERGRADQARRYLSAHQGRRRGAGEAGGARSGIEVTIVRPSGIFGPGDRRLLKLFRNTILRFPTLGRGKSITISPTSTISSPAFDCVASTRRRPIAPTSWPAAR
jgi:hypothetical protein